MKIYFQVPPYGIVKASLNSPILFLYMPHVRAVCQAYSPNCGTQTTKRINRDQRSSFKRLRPSCFPSFEPLNRTLTRTLVKGQSPKFLTRCPFRKASIVKRPRMWQSKALFPGNRAKIQRSKEQRAVAPSSVGIEPTSNGKTLGSCGSIKAANILSFACPTGIFQTLCAFVN